MKRSARVESVAQYSCSLEAIVAVLGGKWRPGILYNLLQGPVRFSELRRRLGSVTEKMLAQQLRELEAHGVIHRHDFAEVPPRVLYSLTPYGGTLRPILERMGNWGQQHIQRLAKIAKAESSSRS